MFKTKRFENWKFFYSIKYVQFNIAVAIDTKNGDKIYKLYHAECAKFFRLPFFFGSVVQIEPCNDPTEYYKQS
jgi:hypothetical protein